jgi:hypothetical protein
MAEISDGYSMDDCRGFSLLRTWYLYILDVLTHSKDQADIIVQRFFQDGEYDLFTPDRKRFRLWFDAVPGGVAPSPFKGEFWQSHPECGIECKINGLTSSARWTGPASAWWRAHGRQFSEYKIGLIWVNDAAMVDFLRAVGFSLTQFDAAQPELPLAEPIHNSPPMSGDAAPPAPEPAPVPEPEWDLNDPNAWTSPETVASNLGLGRPRKPMRAVMGACRKLPERSKYKGKGVAEILIAMKPAELLKTIKCGSPDTCGRLIAAVRTWCERHP